MAEREVAEWTAKKLTPFCTSLVMEPEINGGRMRPDMGIRFRSFPDKPVVVEIKPFESKLKASLLTESVRQCFTYTQALKCIGAVGPIYVDWNSIDGNNQVLFGASIAGAFNVGLLAFNNKPKLIGRESMTQIGMFVMSAQVILRFGFDAYGDAKTVAHPNAERLLTFKQFQGCSVWRE